MMSMLIFCSKLVFSTNHVMNNGENYDFFFSNSTFLKVVFISLI